MAEAFEQQQQNANIDISSFEERLGFLIDRQMEWAPKPGAGPAPYETAVPRRSEAHSTFYASVKILTPGETV